MCIRKNQFLYRNYLNFIVWKAFEKQEIRDFRPNLNPLVSKFSHRLWNIWRQIFTRWFIFHGYFRLGLGCMKFVFYWEIWPQSQTWFFLFTAQQRIISSSSLSIPGRMLFRCAKKRVSFQHFQRDLLTVLLGSCRTLLMMEIFFGSAVYLR